MSALGRSDTTAGMLLAEAGARLSAAGIEAGRREARLLLAHAMATTPERLFARPETPADARQADAFRALTERRAAGEPLSRILGCREFWSLPFRLGPATLDPRPDSETLVQAALDRVESRDAPLRILDFGTGSGCLLLALLSELPAARGLGVDISAAALATAAENARALGLSARADFLCADWDAGLERSETEAGWDVIVSNPPYIETAEISGLDPAVAGHDPRLALDGGADGLDAYRCLLSAVARQLGEAGFAVVELGAGQAAAVTTLAEAAGLVLLDEAADLSGTTRALVFGCRPARA